MPDSLQELVDYEIVPENAPKFAAKIVGMAKKLDDIDLDYSPESLEKVDEMFESFRGDESVTPHSIAATLFSFGCYVGEVFRRANPGSRWVTLPDDQTESSLNSGLVLKLRSGTTVNPIGKAEKRLVNGEGDSLHYFYRALMATEAKHPRR
jgi:hypothetical protein